MTFVWPERRFFTASRGHRYSYTSIPAQPGKKTLVFLHGFPSHMYDWENQVVHFSSRGFGIVVPDLLGYGQSSKPSDPAEYRLKPMSDDLIELLDSVNQKEVVGVGHDFGATLLSRAAAYYPERWLELVFLSVGPPSMATPFDVDMINNMTKQILGYELLGYIAWIGRDPAAQQCLEAHAHSLMSLVFCADHSQWDEWYRPEGRMKKFLEQEKRLEIGSWYPGHLQRRHLEAFDTEDGYKGATRWYQMWTKNLFAADEEGLEDRKIQQRVLFIGDEGSSQQSDMLGAWVHRLDVRTMESGHWIHLERDEAVNEAIGDFIG